MNQLVHHLSISKKLTLITGILFLLVLAGCEGKFFGKSKEQRPITDVDIRKGIYGLTMEFAQNAPPERVFEDSIFPIALSLKNKGASNIENGIRILGLEKTYVDVKTPGEERQVFKIEGKSVFNPVGDEETTVINAKTKKIDPQSETHTSSILATACYPYKTVFGSSVCVDTDIYGIIKEQKACNVHDLVFDEGQGAPVAVTKIETRMLPQDNNKIKPHFIIYIGNRGNGEVVDLRKVDDACTSKALNYTHFNTLIVSASLSDAPLKCSEKENEPGPITIRLRDKEDMIRCTYEKDGGIDARDAYTAPLRIELDYGYTFTISKDIIIEKVLTH